MNPRSILKRSLALLLVLVSVVGLLPVVAAKGSVDDIHIEIPASLAGEDVVEATFGENGEIIYRKASEETISAVNGNLEQGTYADVTDMLTNRAGTDFSAGQRLAFFIDPSNSEGNSNFSTYSLTAARVKNLVAAGVTDLFVMTKNRAGTFSLTDLQTANSNKGSAKVYAWMHSARDNAYLKSHHSATQYHFARGTSNSATDGANTNAGFVHLADSAYITYMEGLVGQATSYADGLLLDSVYFGTEFTGWNSDMKTYYKNNQGDNAKTYYNEAVKAVCATAYSDYGTTYRYKADSEGYYYYVSSGGTAVTSGSTLAAYCNANSAGAKAFGNYRKSVVTNFIGKMKTKFGSSKIIAVALERAWENTNAYKYIHGQDPYNFRGHVKKGFCVTMQVQDNYASNVTTLAKQVAKYTNVMMAMDIRYVGSYTNNGYQNPDTIIDRLELAYTARYDVNGNYATYRGCILGVAGYTMGNAGAMSVVLSGSGAKPTMTVKVANPSTKSIAMMAYFNNHGDTDCGTQTTDGSILKPSGSTMAYFANKTSSGNGAYGYIGAYDVNVESQYVGSNISAYGAATIVVALKNYTVDWDKLPFARIGFYSTNSLANHNYTVGHISIWNIKGHETCTSFTDTTLVTATCTAVGYKRRTCDTCGYDFIVEVAKLGHSYTVVQSTTQPTCTADGSKVMKCSRCTATQTTTLAATGHSDPIYVDNGSNHKITCSKCDRLEYGDHTYSNGVCTLCGHVATKFLHFKANSAEITYAWQMSGGGTVSYNTAGNGIMYGTANGTSAPSFYVDAASADKIAHPITAGDVVQIRLRITDYNGDTTNVSPTVSFDTGSGSFGTALSGNTISLNKENTDWQIVTIPISGYTGTIEQLKINPIGNAAANAKIEIDYIYIGEPGRLPITVTFVNYDGTFLEAYPIDLGGGVVYSAPAPVRPAENNFVFTFAGWKDASGKVVDINTATFNADTTLTAYYNGTYQNDEPISSNKKLVDDDNDLEDYSYNIVIDAATYGESVTIKKEYKQPLDITLVMDRSTSTCFPADETNTNLTWTITNNGTSLTNVLNSLDKTKPEGYYTATNWLGVDYVGAVDTQAGGYISYEDMKWDGSKWVVWQTIELYTAAPKIYNGTDTRGTTLRSLYTDGAYELVRPASVLYKYSNYTYHHSDFGKWVPLATAYTDFFSRCKASFTDSWETTHGLTGYKEANMKFKIAVSRRGVMQDALTTFIDRLATSSSQLPQGQSHRVSIVSYGYQAYVSGKSFTFTNAAGHTATYTCSTDPGVTQTPLELTSSTKTTLKNIINKPFAFGATATDNAFTYATEHQNTMRANAKNSQGIVILFTDGAPTYGDGFFKGTANKALELANAMKTKNTKVFTVGYMDNLNTGTAPKLWSDTDTIANQANTWLHLMSSNYTGVTAMPETAEAVNKLSGNYKAGYYKAGATGDQLSTAFNQIYTMTETTTKVDTKIEGSLVIKDIVTREWDIRQENGSSFIKVQKCVYMGNGEFANPVDLDSSLYSLSTKSLDDGGTEIQVEWKDAPNAWLDDADDQGAKTQGYKLLVTIGIELDRDSTIGGNNIPTNGKESGIYYPNNSDLDHRYDVPNVNVEPLYGYQKHDFFMDLYNPNATIDLIRSESNDDATNNSLVFSKMYTITQAIDGLNNRFVSLEHYLNRYTKNTITDQDGDEITTFTMGNSVFKQVAAPGASGWTDSVSTDGIDLANDSSLFTAGYKLIMKSNDIDSLGRKPWAGEEISLEDGIVNYYAPKYAVLDFGTKVEVPLVNEAEIIMDSGMSKKIALSDDGMFLTYNFEDGSVILDETGSYSYKVSAINAPKGASDNDVYRTLTVLPANNVMYDDTYLTNVDGWTEIGEADERLQSADCTTEHGYDSNLHNLGNDEDYSFGHAYMMDASSKNNNKTMTFSFRGTGFDIISRTGPDDGVMVVEVYTDAAMTNKVKTALANNYLQNATVYQVPVVRYLGLTYGTYYVKIRAYYADVFNAHYTPASTSKAITTDARILADLGIADGETLDYFAASDLVASAKPATRAATGTSYEIVVDGIRIYNPLGTISADTHPEAYYVYGLANEINPTFFNARDLLMDSSDWTFDGEDDQDANGMVYIAGIADSVGSAASEDGVHLSMEGKLTTELSGGKEYLLDSNGKRVKSSYGTDVYVRKITKDGRQTYGYFCLDTEGKEVDVTSSIKVTYYNSSYDVSGPKNEIYLNDGGVAFNVGTGAGRVLIGAMSYDGKNTFLKVYSEADKEFVDVFAHKISDKTTINYSNNYTELYYDVTDYVTAEGDVIIYSPNDEDGSNGILSISGVKIVPKDGVSTMGLRAPAKTVQKAVELIQKPALPEVTLLGDVSIGETLSLENDLTMLFRIKEALLADYDISTAYLVVERDVYGTDGSVTVEVTTIYEYEVTDGRVVYSYTGISAAQMNDEIRVVLHILDPYGNEYVTEEKATSVALYLKMLLEALPSGQHPLCPLVMDLLNYGTAAQLYFNRHADAPVNEAYQIFIDYADYATADFTAPLEDLSDRITNAGATATLGQALDVSTRVGISYKASLPEGVSAENAKLVIKDADGNELETIDLSTGTIDSKGRYVVNFYGSTSRDMRRVVYATVMVDGEAISDTYAYSISSYAYAVANAQGIPADLVNLTKLMVMYGDSAVAYFG